MLTLLHNLQCDYVASCWWSLNIMKLYDINWYISFTLSLFDLQLVTFQGVVNDAFVVKEAVKSVLLMHMFCFHFLFHTMDNLIKILLIFIKLFIV
jgi:hypothetical protein